MPRPKHGYTLLDGTKCPGATTIIGRFRDSGALLHWAWKVGLEGGDINKARDSAADAGTCAHEMIDCHVHERVFNPASYEPLVLEKAGHAFLGFLEWRAQNNLKVVAAEVALVSEKHRFGGSFDAVMTGDSLRIMDYKSSSGVYAEHLIQVAGAYSLLWQEHHPDEPLHGVDILRISKPQAADDPVSFTHHHLSAEILPIAQRAFILMRELYDLDKRLKAFL